MEQCASRAAIWGATSRKDLRAMDRRELKKFQEVDRSLEEREG